MPARMAARSLAGRADNLLEGTSSQETGRNAATLLARTATARGAGKAKTPEVWRSAKLPDRTSAQKTAGMAATTPAGKAGTSRGLAGPKAEVSLDG